MEKAQIKNLRDVIDRHEQVKKEIESLEEEEKYLKEELEKVRNHVVYYTALVSDMKKRMRGTKNMDIFDRI